MGFRFAIDENSHAAGVKHHVTVVLLNRPHEEAGYKPTALGFQHLESTLLTAGFSTLYAA